MLAWIVSPELGDLDSAAREQRAVLAGRRRLLRSAREQVEAGVRPIEALREAELGVAEAQAHVQALQRQLNLRRTSTGGDSGEGRGASPGRWAWRAPIAGQITALRCAPGSAHSAGALCADALETGRAELRVHVPERLIGRLSEDATLQWHPASSPKEPVTMRLSRRAVTVDPESRTQAFYFRPEGDARLTVGATGRARLSTPPAEGVVRVPRSSVTELEGRPTVYIKAAGEVPAQPVTVEVTGRAGEDLLVRGRGLALGAEVVSRGAFLLKSVALMGGE